MGWAVQPGERTVEGELRAALATVLREPVSLTVAGRTDRGVHALAQVVSYEGALPRLRSVNALLPPEIAVLEAARAPALVSVSVRGGRPARVRGAARGHARLHRLHPQRRLPPALRPRRPARG